MNPTPNTRLLGPLSVRAKSMTRAALALTAFLAGASCTTTGPTAHDPQPAPQSPPQTAQSDASQSLLPFESLERLPAEGSLEARDLLPGPAIGSSDTWIALDGLLAPNEFLVRSVAAAESTAPSRVRTRTADLKVMEWSIAEDGSVLLHAVDSLADRTTSLFEPPLLVAPPTLAAGEERSVESAMRAVLTATPGRERDRGTGRRTLRYDRDEWVRWRGERRRAKVAVVRFVAELGSARAERVSELWVIPGEGTVAERWNETLTILRVFDKRSMQSAARR
jgi:hypothetical protein